MLSSAGFRSLSFHLSVLAAEAGRLILDISRRGAEVQEKSDHSPVTDADIAAEELLLAGLGRLLPGVPVLAEESASRGEAPLPGSTFLVVDPLDGTREFVSGRREYTVNIGLVSEGRPVLGVLHVPAYGRTYHGAESAGAARALHEVGALPVEEMFEPIRTRTPPPGLMALTSRGHNDAATEAFLDKLGVVGERQRIGSAYKFALVAEGSADIYPRFGPTMEWDLAAGHALILAAGGDVLSPEGEPVRYGKTDEGYRNHAFVAWGRVTR
ncbi:3'(2'),5'-bisphosphate nucleotidase CysQ [Terrihabitans rhizophilus]|uniref:3'(2'),5'-bisphosphate nucleotidase CysQ n=1 Tax=Terrihabitans rhizophilus TaxID=3092662 RepID=A0ABU4RTB3_9HYPH|nr:3'(2'),5'-bisphosphate nucleotidase CysQ [Terrihabitans sp. PJ23]MDX6807433.1 3'(2'),5'-bisphosphate nucleotidase CysQ [Terrihabitans sp. PJ23]